MPINWREIRLERGSKRCSNSASILLLAQYCANYIALWHNSRYKPQFIWCVRQQCYRINLAALCDTKPNRSIEIRHLDKQSSSNISLLVVIPTIIFAVFLFDVQAVFIKHMGTQYPVEQITVFRNFFGLFPYLLMLLFAHKSSFGTSSWKLKRWKLAFGRGFLLIAAQMCFYYSVVNMQLATATTLAFSGPLFLTLLSIPMFGHKIGAWRWSAVLMGFAGVVIVMKPSTDAFNLVAILPIGAALFYASASLSSRFFDSSVPTALISTYSTLAALFAALVITFATGNWMPINHPADWLWFIAMGAVGGCAVLLMITAYRIADPSLLSPFEYLGIPFSFLLGWYFFSEKPFDSLFPGVILIVGAGLLVIWREQKQKVVVDNEQNQGKGKGV